MVKKTTFGKAVKKRLVDIECGDKWLVDRVREATGLYFDSSYLHKIRTGKAAPEKIISAMCDILDLPYPKKSDLKYDNAEEK